VLYCADNVQGGSNMTGTNCDLFTHKYSRSYLNHLVFSCLLQVGFKTNVKVGFEMNLYSYGDHKTEPYVSSVFTRDLLGVG
jgi:hypothetical protein